MCVFFLLLLKSYYKLFDSGPCAGTKCQALEALSPEVKLFAILKTMANFGQRLSWPQLQLALSQAVQLDVISQESAETRT